ncbi:pimelyl-ACP methyl ester esterase BioV [Halarcobacter anaerophilus]|uniref:pimelyl-ACP methyl ester esterase BioV n=1 Tax=Halarcobacter anaerophilus TaxID=877500 RepID=UPI0005CB7816|nr:pimelyl-ACP methyl ester esterase BioV [Halarcobacter anaerophilus]
MTFKYFSGFCLENEKELFKEYLCEKSLCVAGFSYGAIKAFEYVYNSDSRVDLLQLFSPAFFQTMDKKTKRLQLMFFKKDKDEYIKNFLKNVSFPSNIEMKKYFKEGTSLELEELLNYTWDKEKLQKFVDRGIKIEVFLGQKDKIIDSKGAKEFFKDFATVYYIKEKGHIL